MPSSENMQAVAAFENKVIFTVVIVKWQMII